MRYSTVGWRIGSGFIDNGCKGHDGMTGDAEKSTEIRLEKLRKLQLEELELIKVFVQICEKEQLRYYMLGGTMLGAIRHKGYIPWDDDADFGMPRPDYEHFLAVANKYLPDGFALSTIDSVPDHIYYIARLVNTKVKIKISGVAQKREDSVWIDIFPLDGFPTNGLLRLIHKAELLLLRKMYRLSVFDREVLLKIKHRTWYNHLGVAFCRHIPIQRLFSQRWCWKALDAALKKYPYEQSKELLNLTGAYQFKELFDKQVFGEGAFYDFEEMRLKGPVEYDFYLKQLYGDYMQPPSVDERNKHQSELL